MLVFMPSTSQVLHSTTIHSDAHEITCTFNHPSFFSHNLCPLPEYWNHQSALSRHCDKITSIASNLHLFYCQNKGLCSALCKQTQTRGPSCAPLIGIWNADWWLCTLHERSHLSHFFLSFVCKFKQTWKDYVELEKQPCQQEGTFMIGQGHMTK